MSTELEAYRLLLAGLDLIGEALPIESAAHSVYVACRAELEQAVTGMPAEATPPWEPEPVNAIVPWSMVACGDKVLAPNGQWYPVDSVARIGDKVSAMLSAGGNLIRTDRTAGERVKVERGPVGQAMDLFAAGGLDLETIKSGVAA